ncbi:MAG TPA: sigma-70 family RNA polymerase sigma factor [Candidatus Wallbacteria bacterium]|nr:MAG: ECF RNA polymerase sigma factor SigW [bacterium ADurb.Bin243]HOD41289.1 sigma-70 family RNA polymerase sigma factor [Candidatus Wallbacteria bacterium]HPG57008.1 sigma-70 family RNA polymerase sigma factor [Candidatus Wallbacteria bacterium]
MIIETQETKQLIEGFFNGEDDKTNALISLYYKFVYYNCLRITRDADAAQDLTQDSFVRVYKYRETYDKKYKFSNWLLKISSNVCMDFLRQRGKDRVKVLYIEAIEAGAGSINDLKKFLIDEKAEIEMNEKFEKNLLKDLIGLLPAIYRVTVILKYYNDLKYEEISKILNIPVGTAKFRINRAIGIITKLFALTAERRTRIAETANRQKINKGSE